MPRLPRLLRVLWVASVFAGVLLALAGLLFVAEVAATRLVDCPPGYNYSLSRLRCVGSLEFDLGK